MALSYGAFVTPQIENTTQQEILRDGVVCSYFIKAVEGYVLHDKALAIPMPPDENGVESTLPGYTAGEVSCAASYDFTANPREFYAVPRDSVPADQIFGGGDNDHEIA